MLQTNPKFAPLVEIQEEIDRLTKALLNPPLIWEDIYEFYEYRNMLEDKWTEEFNQLSEEDQEFWYRYFEKPEPTPYDYV
jgi:hypothetical protein